MSPQGVKHLLDRLRCNTPLTAGSWWFTIVVEGDVAAMKAYHGTTATVARASLTEGLRPREETESEGQWEECPSMASMVYLTTTYPGYFAMNAAAPGLKDGELPAIVEVDLEELWDLDLYPDEDFLEQCSRGVEGVVPPGFTTMKERTAWYRDNIDRFQHLWKKSMEYLGNVAHCGTVPPEAITRICVFDPAKAPWLGMWWMDPSITPLNFMIMRHKYENLTRWMFGEELPAESMLGEQWMFMEMMGNTEQMEAARKQYADHESCTVTEQSLDTKAAV